MSKLKTK